MRPAYSNPWNGAPRRASSASTGRWTASTSSLRELGADGRHGRVAPHAARVRALVPVAEALEVLRGREREGFLAGAEREERDLLALEQLLDDDRPPEGLRLRKRRLDLVLRPADEDALSGGQAVGLDHARGPRLLELGRRGDARRLHDLLREGLGALDLRRRRARAEDGDAGVAEGVGEPRDERRLRPDDDEVDRRAGGRARAAPRSRPASADGRCRARRCRDCLGRRGGRRAPSLWAIFHASACSRPPEPTMRTFTRASLIGLSANELCHFGHDARVLRQCVTHGSGVRQ